MPMEKTFDAASAEPEIYARWEEAGAFAAGANAKPGAESFSIVIPPPNVTGSLHIGHALNNTLQDILIRWKRMQGYDTLWQPGQDHAGIATQMVVERKLAAEQQPSRRELGREAFAARIWEWKAQSGSTILNQLRRLGASCDWSRNAFTMSGAPGAPEGEDGNFHDAVLKVFVELHRAGLIYRDKRLVNWDPHFETAISDLEVEQVEEKGNLWRFRYKLADGETYDHPMVREEIDGEETLRPWTPEDDDPSAWEERDYIVVATTRPETMLGDTGVAVAADDVRYAGLVGKSVVLPLVGRRIPIVADEHADPAKGTGAVKITPAHDFNDFEVGKRAGLRRINVMTSRASITINDNPEFLEDCAPAPEVLALDGLDRFVARKAIVDLAEGQGWLDGIDAETHVVPHGDRSKVPVEPWLTDQWFVDAKTLAQEALAAAHDGRATFHPANWVKTYDHWMENIEPWCISRQLWWGHQIPVWYGPDGTIFCEMTEAEAASAAKAHYGEAVELTRDADVLDTWFSSGLWPQGTFGWPAQTPELAKYYPTSVLITGFDIIFFWVARMMMMQYAVTGQKPFSTVYVHALVRDEKGKKMSKSLGNVLDPLELIDEYGADAVRFTLTSMAAMGRDLKLSTQRIAGYRNFGTKLWNAHRFAEMNGVFTGTPAAMPQPQATLNKWIVGETARIREETDAALQNYRFNDAANGLYAFVWGKVCDWYVELSKPLLQDDAPEAAETRQTLQWVLDQCLILLHPIMPFITEELWQTTAKRAGMLVHADWPTYTTAELLDAEADRELNWVIGLIESVRSARAQMHVPAGLQVPMIVTEMDDAAQGAWDRNEAMIKRLARIESIERADGFPKGTVSIPAPGATFGLPLAGLIDIDEEKARLQKSLDKLGKEIGGLKGRLNNPKFAASAPEDVVAEAQANLDARQAEAEQMQAALDRLAEMG